MLNQFNNVFKDKIVLITGHTGFKGSWLSIWLTELGALVHGISIDIPTEPSHFITANVIGISKDIRLDIRHLNQLKDTVIEIQPDFVFHLAAQPLVRKSYNDPIDTWLTNTIGTINLLETLRSLQKKCTAIFITSDKCYNNVEWEWGYRETDELGGPDPYSASKGAAEIAIRSFVKSYFPKNGNIRIAVGRAGNVIGGGDWAEDRIVPDCIKAWSIGNAVDLRNPKATRPWQHVLEPLSGYLSLASKLYNSSDLHGEPFNFGPPTNQNQSVGELVTLMSSYWDKVKWNDLSSQYDGPYESALLKLNCDKAVHHLKWRAVWGFEETIKETALWYKNFYEKSEISVSEFTIQQINLYTNNAINNKIQWACQS
jgi:CDP-glucose 4,6-dehydratase